MLKHHNIFLVGPIGSGKSTIGKQLAEKLHLSFFDSDQEIEKRTGVDISWIFDIEGEKGFRSREEKIIDELTKKKNIVLATGGGSIESKKNRNFLFQRGTIIYLKTNIEEQIIRIKNNKKRSFLKSKSLSVKQILEELSLKRDHLYTEISDLIFDTNHKNIKISVNELIQLIKLKCFK